MSVVDPRLGLPLVSNPPVLDKYFVEIVDNAFSLHGDQHVPVDTLLGFIVGGIFVSCGEVTRTPVS